MQDIYSPRRGYAVIPDDNVVLDPVPTQLFVGTGGKIKILLCDDTNPVIFMAVPTGSILRVRAKKIYASDTNASNILALY